VDTFIKQLDEPICHQGGAQLDEHTQRIVHCAVKIVHKSAQLRGHSGQFQIAEKLGLVDQLAIVKCPCVFEVVAVEGVLKR